MSKRSHQIDAFFRQGTQLHAAGRLMEAEQVYRQVLSVSPLHADALHMLGVLAHQTGNSQAALSLIDQAIAQRPTAAAYHLNRGNALLALGCAESAIEACRLALRHKKNYAEAYLLLGHVLSDLGRPDEAVASYRQAERYKANLTDLHNNIGLALRQSGKLEEAVVALRQAIRRAPQDVHAQSNLAGIMKELGELTEAEALYRAALARQPGDALLHFNLSMVLLLGGQMAEGWREYEYRFEAGAAKIPNCLQPRWDGRDLAGRTLLIRAEQGFGDMIQFCRYAPLVSGGRVILEVHPQLHPLISQLSGVGNVASVISLGEAPTAFDVYCPVLSLPLVLQETAIAPPYLRADPDRVGLWRERLGPDGFKVGIAWQGNPKSLAERGRSIALTHYTPLAQLPDVRLVSLQKHDGVEQLKDTPPDIQIETLGEDFDPPGRAFVDTAAVMQCLDLIITSDTSVAHLAGALGRPVWVALSHVPDWRWLLEREDCPWYPTMRLFRQTRRDSWGEVFAAMTQSLAKQIEARRGG